MSLEGMKIIYPNVEEVEKRPERVYHFRPKFRREPQARWDKRHMRTVSTKLTLEDYKELKNRCMLWGITPYEEMRRLLMVHVIGKSPD